MKEPSRWLDDAATAERLREVLSAHSALPEMPNALHAKLSAYSSALVSQAELAAASVGKGSAQALVSSLSGASLTKVVALVTLMGAAGSAGYLAMGEQLKRVAPTHGAPSSRPVANEPAFRSREPTAAARENEESSRQQSATLDPVRTGARAGHASIPTASATVSPPATDISEEARLLETARGSLASDPAFALAVVQHHELKYPNGQLSAEREFIAVDALLRLGRRAEAERRAGPSLTRDPEGLYAKRLRQLLGRE